jgi:hypothetical protein
LKRESSVSVPKQESLTEISDEEEDSASEDSESDGN